MTASAEADARGCSKGPSEPSFRVRLAQSFAAILRNLRAKTEAGSRRAPLRRLPAAVKTVEDRSEMLLPAKYEEREHLEARVRGDECGLARGVERRRDLDTVEAPEIEPGDRAHVRQRLAARGAADRRR